MSDLEVRIQTLACPASKTDKTFHDTLAQAIVDGGEILSSGYSNNTFWAIVQYTTPAFIDLPKRY